MQVVGETAWRKCSVKKPQKLPNLYMEQSSRPERRKKQQNFSVCAKLCQSGPEFSPKGWQRTPAAPRWECSSLDECASNSGEKRIYETKKEAKLVKPVFHLPTESL